MVNEKLESELEYKLPEEGAALKEMPEMRGATVLPKAKTSSGKRILIPIILIVAIILLYRGINWYSQRSEQVRQQQMEAVAAKSAESTAATPIPVAPLASPATLPAREGASLPPTVVRSADELSVQQKLDILASRTVNNTEKLDSLRSSLDQTQTAMVNLNKNVSELSTFTKDLTANLQQFIATQAKARTVKQVRRRRYLSPKVAYRVKAIVPGMAWLESSDGQTVAVRVGSRLGRYGEVRLISPKQGMVVTSDGSELQYGSNDF